MNLTKKKRDFLFYAGAFVIALLVFTLLGEKGYYEYKDSPQYISLHGGNGIMPLYPAFIHLHRMILGDEIALYGVVVSQTVISIGCVMGFLIWIRRRFRSGYFVSALAFFASLVPFTLDLPLVMVNHSILTEALAYPLFYLFVIIFTEALLRMSYRWICGLWISAVCMALIRSQMQLCFVFAAAALFWVGWLRAGRKIGVKKAVLRVGAILFSILFILIGELLFLKINDGFWQILRSGQDGYENVMDKKSLSDREQEKPSDTNIKSQFRSLLVDRTFYEMDEDDQELFEDPELEKLFGYVFHYAEEEKNRYVYARKGLWKWQDIMNGTAGGTHILSYAWEDYMADYPDSSWAGKYEQVKFEMGIVLLKEHWPRMIYHTLCILPQGFISTVFFQIEKIYVFCYAYAFLIYISAVIMIVLGTKNEKISHKRVVFLTGIILLNILLVGVTSIMFFGMQRYLIYGFGVFYASYLLILEEYWKAYGREIWKKVKSRF